MVKLKAFDQLISASSSYLPLFIFVVAEDFQGAANCSIVFSFYFFVLSLIRGSVVSVAHKDSKLNVTNFDEGAKSAFLLSIIPTVAMIIFAIFTTDLSRVILAFFSLGILAASITEIYRLSLLNEDKVISAIVLDLSIVIFQVMMIISLLLVGKSLDLVLVVWAVSFILPMFLIISTKGIPTNLLKIPELLSINIKDIVILSLVPVLALIHSIFVNIMLILSVGSEGLGVFRSVLLFFIPLNFLLNFQTIVYLPYIANGRNDQALLMKRNLLAAMSFVFIFSSIAAINFVTSNLVGVEVILLIGLLSLIPAASNLDSLRLIATSQFRTMIYFRISWLFVTGCSLISVMNYESLLFSILMLCGAELWLFLIQMGMLRKQGQTFHD
jgi:hypothetical protein